MGKVLRNDIDYTGASIVELTKAEYDALPSTKYSDGITYLIKDVYSTSSPKVVGMGDCYSTSEKEIGCWVDGKPLYQKTKFSTSNLSYNALNTVSLGISNVDKFVSVTGFIAYGNDKNFIPLPYGDRGNSNVCIAGINADNGEAKVWIGSDYQSYNVANLLIITVQYTKTTDVAGSGDWTPSGVPAVHYSTDEQIIGTWVNGKTLYQKTWIKTIPNQTGFFEFSDSVLASLDEVVETSYSVRNIGEQGATPWYTSASVYFDAMNERVISFYFTGTYNAGHQLIFTAKYTKSS